MSAGARIEVASALRPMPSPENAPAVSLSSKALQAHRRVGERRYALRVDVVGMRGSGPDPNHEL